MANDGSIVTIFRSRLRPDAEGYADEAARMAEAAMGMPGFIDVKAYTADDGERVTIVTFESEETQRAWREHPGHRVAQKRGRAEFYSWYRLQVCRQVRETTFTAEIGAEQ